MNNEEIIKAVKNSLNVYSFTAQALEMLIENTKREEREACAKVCEEEAASWARLNAQDEEGYGATQCAAAIRARGDK